MYFPARCLAFQVIEHTLGLIDDLPLLLPNFETEIDILKAVSIAFVESIHLLENTTTHEHAGGGDALQFAPSVCTGRLGAPSAIHMVRHQTFT